MMPLLSGIEVCRRLKTRPETRDIPVIMLSARRVYVHIAHAKALTAQGEADPIRTVRGTVCALG